MIHSIFPYERISEIILVHIFLFIIFLVWRFTLLRRVCLVLLCILFGFWRFNITIPSVASQAQLTEKEVIIEGIVSKKLSFWSIVDGRFAVRGLQKITPYSFVRVTCQLDKIPFSSGFDRRLWFARQGIWFECTSNNEVYVRLPDRWNVFSYLRHVRDVLSTKIRDLFEASRAELLIGMLYGSPDFLPDDLEIFRRSGLMHLVAVSGSNISIVVIASFTILLRIGFRRRHAFWLTTLSVMTYVCFVGFSASVLRAALMAWLSLFGRDRGRIVHPVVLLLGCAVFLNLWNPWQLVFDPGFVLSFLAMIGLVGIARPFQDIFYWIPKNAGLRETVCMTFGATMMTSPYLAYCFGQWSLAGMFTNLIAVPLVPWVMGSGACASVIDNGLIGNFCHQAAFGFLNIIYMIARWSSVVPGLSGYIQFPLWMMLFVYFLLFGWMWHLKKSFPQVYSKSVYFF
ncbi:ComEC/Rec2 family competence protein [Candidatus Uhrbacteria bacterium]|nr:ComEC/Rec2 family competence protein [Candidatus Uhrbacteria bacterium]